MTTTMTTTMTGPKAPDSLSTLRALASDDVWVVGGAVRDALAGEAADLVDVDIAAASGETWAQRAAESLDGVCIHLNPRYPVWRVITLDFQIDVWDLAGAEIEDDLRRRDFTVNAMAAPLGEFLDGDLSGVIDPCGGGSDVTERRLRMASGASLQNDPLRLLRAIRFEAEGDWRPDAGLWAAMKRDAALITQAAPERQWMELRRILESDRLPWALRRMDRSGLLDAIFPELTLCRGVDQRPVHRRDVFRHQIDAVRWLTRLTSSEAPRSRRAGELWGALSPLLEQDEVHTTLREWRLPLRLATLLHDIGKPQTRTVGDDGRTHFFGHSEVGAETARERLTALRAPERTIQQVELLIEQHLRPGQVSSPGRPPTSRALHRFHRALGEAAVPLCWLFLADSLATAGAEALLPRWPAYAAHVARIIGWQPARPTQEAPLLDGRGIMEATGLAPGPLVGEIRAKIVEAAAVGDISDAAGARRLAQSLAEAGSTE